MGRHAAVQAIGSGVFKRLDLFGDGLRHQALAPRSFGALNRHPTHRNDALRMPMYSRLFFINQSLHRVGLGLSGQLWRGQSYPAALVLHPLDGVISRGRIRTKRAPRGTPFLFDRQRSASATRVWRGQSAECLGLHRLAFGSTVARLCKRKGPADARPSLFQPFATSRWHRVLVIFSLKRHCHPLLAPALGFMDVVRIRTKRASRRTPFLFDRQLG